MQKQRHANRRFAKAGVSCFFDSEVLNSNFVHLMKFSAENPRLRKAAKRWTKFAPLILSNVRVLRTCGISVRGANVHPTRAWRSCHSNASRF
jgi:hypothetical protein